MKVLVSTVAALCLGSTALAQDIQPKTYFSLGVGAFELESDEVIFPDFNDETTNEVDTGVALYGLIGRRMGNSPLSVEGEVGVYTSRWDGFADGSVTFTCDPRDDCLDEVIRTTSLTANAVLSAPMNAPIRPYAGVGAGLMITDFNLEDVDPEVGFGYLLKVGADIPVAGFNRVGIQYTYLGAPEVDFDGGFAEFDVSGNTILLQWTSAF